KLAWRGDAIPGLNNDGTVDAALRLEMQIPDFVGFLSDERHAITQILGALDLPGQQLQISAGEIELLTPQRDSRRWGRWRTLGAWLVRRGAREIVEGLGKWLRNERMERSLWQYALGVWPLAYHAGEA